MSIVIAIGGQQFAVDGEEITIGYDSTCGIVLPQETSLAPCHATLRSLGGRWLIEARADQTIQVGDAAPGRLAWLRSGDVIRLTPKGSELVFDPPATTSNNGSEGNSSRLGGSIDQTPQTPAATVRNLSANSIVIAFAACALLIGGVWFAVSRPTRMDSPNPVAVNFPEPVGATVSPPDEMDVTTNAANQVVTTTKPGRAQESPSASVYAVLVANEDREQVFQVGTAWAVSQKALITSGEVVLALESLRANLSLALVRRPATNAEFFVVGRVHPRFRELTESANRLQARLLDLDQQCNAATEATAKQLLEKQLQEVDLQLVAQLREAMYFDVGILEVRDDLPHWLRVATDGASNGQRVRMVGVPFPDDEQLLNPDRPPAIRETSGQLLARLPAVGQSATPFVFGASLAELHGQQWSGAPVVNSTGLVVGTFSRLAPPDMKAVPQPEQLRPHATDARVVRELLPNLD